jgi:hypothetical protein
MELRPAALRFVLEQGLGAVIEVRGASMEPSIPKGAKVAVAALALTDELSPGEVVLLVTTSDVLLLHRVMHVFVERGQRFVVHQGDALDSTFGVAARDRVFARMTAFEDPSRPAPTTRARLDAAVRARFLRRRVACRAFVAARRLANALGVARPPLLRRCATVIRRVARRLTR